MNRIDLQNLANARITEAKILLDAQQWPGAYYFAGYAVEFGLKACIAKLTKQEEFPDKNFSIKCWVHDIEQLVELTGLKTQRNLDAGTNANWRIVRGRKETSRYQWKSQSEDQALYDAITHSPDGVLLWIQSHW